MKELVFLLEERSAKALLESLLPRMLNKEIEFRCIRRMQNELIEKHA